MKILITGGAGFIGSAVVRHIIRDTTASVINLDKLTYAGNLESIPPEISQSSRYSFEQVDICDRNELERVFRQHQPDAVMHLAAESHVDRSIDGPGEFIQTNIVGTYELLEAARSYWQQLPEQRKQQFRFHHISTDEVYGDLPHPNDLAPEGAPVGATSAATPTLPLFTETTSYAPSSPYSASKAASDHLVRAWHRTYGLPVLVTNCSNNYGPYHFPEKLIPHVILNALAGKPLPIYGKGDQIRDWLYVEDHARVLYKVVTEGKVGETYNIGGHNEKQNIEVVKEICRILDELAPRHTTHSHPARSEANSQDPQPSYTNLITHVQDRPGHDRRYAIDSSKMQTELSWTPIETFETGLRKTVEWYLNNRQWWQNVLSGSYKLQRIGDNA